MIDNVIILLLLVGGVGLFVGIACEISDAIAQALNGADEDGPDQY